jgi:hypothetical protein
MQNQRRGRFEHAAGAGGRRAFSGKPKATAGIDGTQHGWASQPWHTGIGVGGRSHG